ncbi:MAG: cation:proton antiporter [Caldilineaceae bacterium]|nr:cation:proton antiporter [Caldilineaceae bacterium]
MNADLTIFFLVIVIYALIAGRLDRWLITMPIFFVVAGALLGDLLPGFTPAIRGTTTLTEITLALLLFADATTISFTRFMHDNGLPERLLFVGLPASMLLGGLAAWALFPQEGVWFALLLAAILTPTDAALGLAIFNNEKVPTRVRRALNVESGLNDGMVTPFVALFLAMVVATDEGALEPFLRPALAEIGIAVVVAAVVGTLGGRLFDLAQTRKWTTPSIIQIGGLALALTAYFGSVSLGGNGFIAAFVAGLLFGRVVKQRAHHIVEFTETSGTLLSLLVWTLFGSFVPQIIRDFEPRALLFALFALTLMRMPAVALALRGSGLRRDTVALMGWFGPRGLASVVFTLIALEEYERLGLHPNVLVAAAGWTVLLSVVLHGVSAQPLANWYARRLQSAPPDSPEFADASELTIRRSSLAHGATSAD